MVHSDRESDKVCKLVVGLSGGGSVGEIEDALGSGTISRRTLQRLLRQLVLDGRLLPRGEGRGRRYLSPEVVCEASPSWDLPKLSLSVEGERIRKRVAAPLTSRQPVGYSQSFLDVYEPNVSFYLPADTRAELAAMGQVGISNLPAGTFLRRLMDRLLIDLSWNSSRLEGNTYSLLETQRLFELGEIAEGKAAEDAQMVLNHKAAIELLASSTDEVGFNRYTVCNLHALLADNLLMDPAACGQVRSRAVGITGTTFIPLENPHDIERQFDQILSKGAQIQDPFEQAFFAMVHLPYLQPFEDVNKRVSRLVANVPFVRENLCPLSFIDVPQAEYVSGLLGVYELQSVELLRDVFIWAYTRSAARYSAIRQSLGEPDPFRLRYRGQLSSIVREVVQSRLGKSAGALSIRRFATRNLAAEDQEHFVEVVDTELASLHAGNIARYRLRPTEFAAWHEQW